METGDTTVTRRDPWGPSSRARHTGRHRGGFSGLGWFRELTRWDQERSGLSETGLRRPQGRDGTLISNHSGITLPESGTAQQTEGTRVMEA